MSRNRVSPVRLSSRQVDCYRFIERYIAEHGKGPRYSLLADAVMPGLNPTGIATVLRALRSRGFVRWEGGDYTTLKIMRPMPESGVLPAEEAEPDEIPMLLVGGPGDPRKLLKHKAPAPPAPEPVVIASEADAAEAFGAGSIAAGAATAFLRKPFDPALHVSAAAQAEPASERVATVHKLEPRPVPAAADSAPARRSGSLEEALRDRLLELDEERSRVAELLEWIEAR